MKAALKEALRYTLFQSKNDDLEIPSPTTASQFRDPTQKQAKGRRK